MEITEKQFSLLLKEGYIATASIRHGLNALNRAGTHAKGEYYQAFFQLSIGLERLMKLIIIQYYRGMNNTFPDNKVLKSYGHDLYEMFHAIIEFDTKLIQDNNDISMEILKFLSQFAKTTRYYNLDTLTGRQHGTDPLIQWKDIQELILQQNPKRKTSKSKLDNEIRLFLNEISAVIVFDENNKIIENAEILLNKIEIEKYVQEYSVYYTYLLIKGLAKNLENIEFKYKLYPYLFEFFSCFLGGFTKYEIRKKKNWLNC